MADVDTKSGEQTNQLLAVINELRARVDALERRPVQADSLDHLAETLGTIEAGELRCHADPADPHAPGDGFSGVRVSGAPMSEYSDAPNIAGVENDVPTFWLRSADGAASFLGGSAVLSVDGVNITGANTPYTHTVGSGASQRTGILTMTSSGGVTEWGLRYKKPVAAVAQIDGSTTWTTSGTTISASGQNVTAITNEISGGDATVTAVTGLMRTYPGAQNSYSVTVKRGLAAYTPDCLLDIQAIWYTRSDLTIPLSASSIVYLDDDDIPASPTVFTATATTPVLANYVQFQVRVTHDISGYNQSVVVTDLSATREACEQIISLTFSDRGTKLSNAPLQIEKLTDSDLSDLLYTPVGGYASVYAKTDTRLYYDQQINDLGNTDERRIADIDDIDDLLMNMAFWSGI